MGLKQFYIPIHNHIKDYFFVKIIFFDQKSIELEEGKYQSKYYLKRKLSIILLKNTL